MPKPKKDLLKHTWKGGSGRPFRANCTICGKTKQDLHEHRKQRKRKGK